ncbi:MAG: M20/M25/M40 family metallo-hydrolase [Firmicutes bacterium]|nr:M20/M25/M40 family metallo-hydrolase [Bacillota bacterium]
MKHKLSNRIKEITLELVRQKSVVETDGEVTVSDKVFEIMSQMDYYKSHPENLYFLPVQDDPWDRKVVVAILKGEKTQNKKTVVLIGHTDTVGISDYGTLAEYATEPEELVTKLKELSLNQEVLDDIASGKYLFGRGIFDMKSGDAVVMALMEEISKDVENFDGNLIFAAVCDEEGNSKGMLTFVPELIRLKREFGYDYQAILDPDYIAPAYPGDPNVYQYIGTVGKLMPTFLAIGKETHVGESFSGLDPNKIVSEITGRVSLNPEFSDVVAGEVTLPPVTLKQRDLKPEYSVQIANKAFIYFNYATHCSTPDQVMEKMLKVGSESFQEVVKRLNERYHQFCNMNGRTYTTLPWKERTMSYTQLYAHVKEEFGEGFDEKVQEYIEEISKDSSLNIRRQTMKVVEYVHSLWSDKDPILLVYLTPPYYPHVYVEGSRPKEKALIDAIAHAVSTTECDYPLVQKKFLPCISDLSYASAPKEEKAIEALKQNMPGFGTIYRLPIEDMQELDLPVADIGSYGKDAHQFTERVETGYSFGVLPEILYKTMVRLLEK